MDFRLPIIVVFVVSFFLAKPAWCQLPDYESCLSSFTANDGIHDDLNRRLKQDLKEIEGPKKGKVKYYYKERKGFVDERLEEQKFLYCSELDNYLNSICDKILSANPGIRRPERIFIEATGSVNAYCIGEGSLVITMGLLERFSYEDELAFVLSHEIAHYHLNHVNKSIRKRVLKYNRNAIKRGKVDLGALKSIVYDDFHYSKRLEKEADSLGLTLLMNSTYNAFIYKRALYCLDSLEYNSDSDYPDLKKHFDFENYPFQKGWTQSSGAALYNDEAPVFLFNKDSVHTHPEIEERIRNLEKYLSKHTLSSQDSLFTDIPPDLKRLIGFELLMAVFKSKEFISAMFHGLTTVEKFPDDQQFKGYISNLLIGIYEARENHELGKYVPTYMDQNNPMHPYVTFLNNLRLTELSEITYQYIHSNIAFDPESEYHYFLLWKGNTIGNRMEAANQIKNSYSESFPHGQYDELNSLEN